MAIVEVRASQRRSINSNKVHLGRSLGMDSRIKQVPTCRIYSLPRTGRSGIATSECCLLTFNTISPMKLIGKLNTLGWSTTLRYWILTLLTSTLENVQIGSLFSQCSTPEAPRAVCSSPSCSHCTPMTALPDIRISLLLSMPTPSPSSAIL